MTECTCNKCGWVHMAVTRKFAEDEVLQFLAYYDNLSEEKKHDYYGEKRPDPMKQYERCFSCGQTDGDFREAKADDCPSACTIQATIWEP